MNVMNVFASFGSLTQATEQIVPTQSTPQQISGHSFQQLLGQKVEEFKGNEEIIKSSISLVDIKEKLEVILFLLFGKTKEELDEILGEEISDIISPVLEQLHRLIEQNEAVNETEVVETNQLTHLIGTVFASASLINLNMNQIDGSQFVSHETSQVFYRFLSLVESLVTQQMQQKNNLREPLNEQSMQLQKFEQAVEKIIEQLKTNFENHQQRNQGFSENKGLENKSVHLTQQGIPFQQTAMDRIQQLEWRIQLVDETDSSTFVKEFEKVLMSTNLRTFKNGLTELQLRLYPEHLGRLSIKLIHQDGLLLAKITTQTEAAKQLIESQLHQLRHALIAQNIQIEKIEITSNENVQHQPQQKHADAQEEDRQHHGTNQFEREEEHRDEEEQSFREWLDSLIL